MNEEMKQRKDRKKYLVVILGTVVCMNMVFAGTTAKAFFNRGQVTVHCSRQSVALEAGQSPMTIGLAVSPESDSQTAGCGMADCPDSCHGGCLDSKGNCTCAGTEYKTYTTDISVSSSNPSVALGSYSGGTLIIEPLGPGTATITVTGTLREWSSGSSSVQVTVTGDIPKEPEPEPEKPEPAPEPEPTPEPEKPEPTIPGETQTAEPGNPGNTDQGTEQNTAGNEDPFKQGTTAAKGEGQSTVSQKASAPEEKLKEELKEQIPEEKPVITEVPKLSKEKEWKVYSLGDADGKESGNSEKKEENTLGPVAAGAGFLLLSTGFILKLILFKSQI